jgi:hypothetical protein
VLRADADDDDDGLRQRQHREDEERRERRQRDRDRARRFLDNAQQAKHQRHTQALDADVIASALDAMRIIRL